VSLAYANGGIDLHTDWSRTLELTRRAERTVTGAKNRGRFERIVRPRDLCRSRQNNSATTRVPQQRTMVMAGVKQWQPIAGRA